MAQNEGTLIIAPIRPSSSEDIFASVFANEGKGGFHTTLNLAGMYNIPASRREVGMLCYVVEENKFYQLLNGTSNLNWIEAQFSTVASVTSVNSLVGNVFLTTNDIPETLSRTYFNRQRLIIEMGLSSLDIVGDVEYDTPRLNNNVLTWNSTKQKWVPRSAAFNLTLDDLSDVVVNYDPGFYTGITNLPILKIVQEIDSVTGEIVNTSEDTGLKYYNRTWVLGWQDSENKWTVKPLRSMTERMLLLDLQDINVNYTNIESGQVLQWDGNLNQWVAGAVVDINDSDDIPEGEINKYLTPTNLRNTANSSLEIGHLKNVADSLIGMTPLSHPSAVVLGWVPARARWETVNALTDAITTANVPEPTIFPGIDPPFTKAEMNPSKRFYFTGERVKNTLGLQGRLDWFFDVDYPFGKSHGEVLAWNATEEQWQPSNAVQGVFTTDDVPEGDNNLYYTDLRLYWWAYANIRPSINYHEDVNYSNPANGQVLMWQNNAWIAGDALIPPPQLQGQYLRVDYSQNNSIVWSDREQLYGAIVQYSDLPRQRYSTIQDLNDTFSFLGRLLNQTAITNFQNPIGLGLVDITSIEGTTSLNYLCDKTYYSDTLSISNPIVSDPDTIAYTDLTTNGLLIDFKTASAYRVEQLSFQARVTGNHVFGIYVSKNGTTWTKLNSFEIGEEMLVNNLLGLNSEIVSTDISLNQRYFYLIRTSFLNTNFNVGNNLDNAFYRYVKIELEQTTDSGTVSLVEVDIYGWFNSGIKTHTLTNADIDKYLLSGLNNLEIIAPGVNSDIADLKIEPGFQCWLIADNFHTLKIYTTGIGRIYNTLLDTNTPTINNPILLPPKTVAKLVYVGAMPEVVSEGPPLITTPVHKWYLQTGINSGGSGGSGSTDSFLLNRANHLGTQSVSTITGLNAIAISGSYNDLSNKPAFKTVATSGSYNDLTNKPSLGTASTKDAGTLAGQVLLLTTNNRLPALDGSLLTNLPSGGTGTFNSPATTKGDIIVHGITEEERLGIGTNGYVLIADNSEPLGVRWGTVTGAGTDALTLNGQPATYYLDRTNQTGEIPVGAVTGLATVATTNNYNSLNNLPVLGSASTKNTGTSAGEVLLITEDNKLPALDGSLLTGINSPLTTRGDIIVRANGVDARLPVGANNQVLVADSTASTGVAWKNPESSSNTSLFNGQNASYYLDRTNHTGTQPASSISNLSTVATTGSYPDLLNRPTLSTVATSGSYNDLINKPVLGTASQFNTGTGPLNIIQLTVTGQLPDILKSQLTSTTVNEGDLIVRGAISDINLAIGTQGQFLSVDTAIGGKLKWVTLDIPDPVLPTTSKGDIISHNGTDSAILSLGIDKQILSVDLLSPTGLKWIDNIANADNAGNADLLQGQSGAYYLDRTNHTGTQPVSTITGLSSIALSASYNDLIDRPTLGTVAQFNVGVNANNIPQLNVNGLLSSTIIPFPEDITFVEGDLIVRGASEEIALPIGVDGYVLMVDSLVSGKVKWASLPNPATNLPTTAKGDLISHDGVVSTILPLGLGNQILSVDLTSPTGLKWINNIANADNAGNADLLQGQSGAYYLDRTNHTGTQPVATITGLSSIAVSGSYNDLLDRPTLGTASTLNVGINANNVIQLDGSARLPAVDGSLLTGIQSPLSLVDITTNTTLTRHSSQLALVAISNAPINVTLPINPSEGDRVTIADKNGNNPSNPTGFGKHRLQVIANTGQTIQGYNDIDLDTENSSLGIIFSGNKWSICYAEY